MRQTSIAPRGRQSLRSTRSAKVSIELMTERGNGRKQDLVSKESAIPLGVRRLAAAFTV
jgi:hypothetical protein